MENFILVLFQDTVLAIQALASVANLLTERNEQNLSITFTHSEVDTFLQSVTITEENANHYYTYSVTILVMIKQGTPDGSKYKQCPIARASLGKHCEACMRLAKGDHQLWSAL